MRAQPRWKARRLGTSAAEDQPGRASKATGSYCATRGGVTAAGGHCAQTGQAGQPPALSRTDTCWQAASSRIAVSAPSRARAMWVIFLEIAVVLAIAALIVWWTWPRQRKDD